MNIADIIIGMGICNRIIRSRISSTTDGIAGTTMSRSRQWCSGNIVIMPRKVSCNAVPKDACALNGGNSDRKSLAACAARLLSIAKGAQNNLHYYRQHKESESHTKQSPISVEKCAAYRIGEKYARRGPEDEGIKSKYLIPHRHSMPHGGVFVEPGIKIVYSLVYGAYVGVAQSVRASVS